MRPEAARERDLHRYYKPWKEVQTSLVDVQPEERGDAWGLTYEGYKPRASGDKTLTAFAQLATLRLNVRRAMVSLVDSTQQYILAEATQTLSLISDERHKPGDEVWLGNTIIKRSDAVCHHCFGQTYTATDANGQTYTTEGLLIPDMRLDDRFKDKDYVKSEPGVVFYVGVPIITKSGHRIGIYAVSDEKPRAGITIDELIFMEDVAAAVMEHLELAKDRDARLSGEKMVRGLADFIEGIDEPDDDATSTEATTPAEEQNNPPRVSAVMRKQSENAQRMLDDMDEKDDHLSGSVPRSIKPTKSRQSRDDPDRIIDRAAKIIRQSTAADGVVFFNTSSRNFQVLGRRGLKGDGTDLSSGVNSGSDMSNDSAPQPRHRLVDTTDSGEDFRGCKNDKPRRRLCEVIGLSISQHEQYGRLAPKDFGLPEESMERYIKNFPYGKFFSFTENGSGVSSGDELSSEEKTRQGTNASDKNASVVRPDGQSRSKSERFIPAELLKVLPGIRSLIFLPLWDFTEGKFIAGGFIWTSAAGRLMTPDHELPFLKAFGNSIMSEISRVKATKSSIAKTTFIASISHELRSPLHGILGSVEFLHETASSPYQAGLFASIETCGRTLLDTIDHVLDYAKINKLKKSPAGRRRAYPRNGQKKDQVGSIVGLTTEFDLATLVEEVVDAVSAGHVFRRSHQESARDQEIGGAPLSGALAVEPFPVEPKSDNIPVVILDIKPRDNWFVRTQPGALRRIVMNLLGNALKYTDTGFVSLSMQVDSETDHTLKVRLKVMDSGKGMSLEFQRTRLFQPFSQEDPFSTGTGLGLSIVRQIVEALDGHISVSSAQHIGTDVEVVLCLPAVDKASEKQSLSPPITSTQDATISIINPAEVAFKTNRPLSPEDVTVMDRLQEALQDTCEGWFRMKVADDSDSASPDFVLLPITPASTEELLKCNQGASVCAKTLAPIIALCSDTGQASEFRNNVADRLLENGIHSIPVTQPLGPRKLAAVLEKLKEEQNRQKQRIVLGRKESDPEAVRREREILRKAHEAQREEEKSKKDLDAAQGSLDKRMAPVPKRPGPSALVNVEAVGDDAQELSSTSPTRNMTLARIEAQDSSLRSMSAPPAGLMPSKLAGAIALASRPSVSSPTRTRVLLVDDNDINLQLLVMFMKKQNLPYATACNGLQALEAYQAALAPTSPSAASSKRANGAGAAESGAAAEGGAVARNVLKPSPPFTHVLMDLSMPVMDGLTSTRKIRAFEAKNGIDPPSNIIALTGLASAEAQEDAISAGINEFLVKPVKFGELKGLLKDPGSG